MSAAENQYKSIKNTAFTLQHHLIYAIIVNSIFVLIMRLDFDKALVAADLLDALVLPTRRNLLNTIIRHGMSTRQELVSQTGFSRALVYHHLRILVESGLVEVHPTKPLPLYSLNHLRWSTVRSLLREFRDRNGALKKSRSKK
jgi:DNA-binding transcriptional ArsR family regulator